MGWKFIGQGAYLVGVPPRDLTDDDAEAVKRWEEREGVTLDKSGLYVRDEKKGAKPTTEEV